MYDVFNFSVSFVAMIAAVMSTLIAILLNKNQIKNAIKEEKINSFSDAKDILSRRKFIIGSSIVVAILIYNLIKMDFISTKIKTFLFLFLPNANQLVINKNTGVVHHKIFCKNHLPKEKNIQKNIKLLPNIKFHKSRKIEILNHISQNIRIEDSIQVLLLAVENNPTSVHLYDNLIKLFGTIKRYESIYLLLNNAEHQLVEKIAILNNKTKEYKQYNKALQYVKLQQKKALERAIYKALSS